MLRLIYVVRSNRAPERHLRKREGHQLTCSCQSKACAVDVNAHLGVHTAQGVENKELQTKRGVLLMVYMLGQRLRLIGQAITSDAAYSAALHKAWFVACIASACSSYALLGTTSSPINTSAAIKAWSLAGIAKPAAHTHSLAPTHQLPKPEVRHVSPRLPLVPTPWHHLIAFSAIRLALTSS